jgi:hypothetical protein
MSTTDTQKRMAAVVGLCMGFALLVPYRCSLPVRTAGGTEGGNTAASLQGTVVYEVTAKPAAGSLVRLRTSNFLNDTGKIPPRQNTVNFYNTLTDSNGRFSIDSVDTGSYCIEVNDGKSNAVVLKYTVGGHDSLVKLPPDTLRRTSTISGTVASMPDSVGLSSMQVYIYGLERTARRDSLSGVFVIEDVPRGNYTIRVVSSSPRVVPKEISSVAVSPGGETNVGPVDLLSYKTWKHSRKIFLNTTASGAGVGGGVAKVPVLIRLTNSNFNFNEAGKNGDDIRFARSDSAALSFEIERWDSANGFAEIWVCIDTVFGNDSMQNFTMYWGASSGSVLISSNSAAVFDTSNGFQGVWHLQEPGGAPARDATVNHFNGTPSDTSPVAAFGPIGNAKAFNGTSSFFDMKNTASGKLNFPENGTYTVSAWAYADTLDNKFHVVVGKSDNQYFLKLKQYYPPNPMRWEFVEYQDNSGWDITDSLATAKEWKYLVGIRDGVKQYFFVDGELADSSIELKADTLPRKTTDDVTIGKYLSYSKIDGSYCPFKGMIDEVRISNVARSADWIKLCFMNQKPLDALVKMK